MKKRKKVIRAGSLVYAVISTPPMPKDPEHVRAAKSKATTQARKALNLKSAYQKFPYPRLSGRGCTPLPILHNGNDHGLLYRFPT